MSRLPRPYIPMPVRVAVAERQVREQGSIMWPVYLSGVEKSQQLGLPMSLADRLKVLLDHLFGPDAKIELHHTPALALRKRGRNGGFIPDANDPDHLEYMAKDGHLQQTTGRKPGAAKTITSKGSDRWMIKKFNRLEGKTKRRPKQKIPSRPFSSRKRSFR